MSSAVASIVTSETGTGSTEIPIEEDVYEVDFVVDIRQVEGRQQFRIRWRGFGPDHDTWEPEENLLGGCRDLVQEFLKNNETLLCSVVDDEQPAGEEAHVASAGPFAITSDEHEQKGDQAGYITSPVTSYYGPEKKQDSTAPNTTVEDGTEIKKAIEEENKEENVEAESSEAPEEIVSDEKDLSRKHGRKKKVIVESEEEEEEKEEDAGGSDESGGSEDRSMPPGYTYGDPIKLLKDKFWHDLQFGDGLSAISQLGTRRVTRSSAQSSISSLSTPNRPTRSLTRRGRSDSGGSDVTPEMATNLQSKRAMATHRGRGRGRGRGARKCIRGGRSSRVRISSSSSSESSSSESEIGVDKDLVSDDEDDEVETAKEEQTKTEATTHQAEKQSSRAKSSSPSKKQVSKENRLSQEAEPREPSVKEKNIEDAIASVLSQVETNKQREKVSPEAKKLVKEAEPKVNSANNDQQKQEELALSGSVQQPNEDHSAELHQPWAAPVAGTSKVSENSTAVEKLEESKKVSQHQQLSVNVTEEKQAPAASESPPGQSGKRRCIYDRDLPIKVSADLDLGDFFKSEMRASQHHAGRPVTQAEFRIACLQGDTNTVRLAVQYATKHKDSFKIDPEDPDINGDTLLMQVGNRACDLAHQADDVLEYLVQAGADVNRQNSRGYCALHYAVEIGALCKVTKLLSFKASVNRGDNQRMTPLMVAAKKGYAHIIYRLLEGGADFHAFADVPRSELMMSPGSGPLTIEQSALDLAIAGGHKRCVDMLSEHIAKVKLGFDQAMAMVLQDIKIKRQMCPLHCYALSEAESFRVVFPFENVPLPNNRYGYITVCALAKFQAQQVSVRLWGPCPIRSVELNSLGQHVLQQEGRFMFACWPLQTGNNTVTVHCNPDCRQSQMKLLIQVLLVQLKQPKLEGFE